MICVFLITGPMLVKPVIFRRVFRVKELPVYLQEALLTNKSNSLTHTVASSFVGTSPLAVTTVIGLSETVTVSHSAELRSFLVTTSMLAPESTTKSFFRL